MNFSWCAYDGSMKHWKLEIENSIYPVKDHIAGIFKEIVIRVPHDLDIPITGASFRTQAAKHIFGVFAVARKRLGHLSAELALNEQIFGKRPGTQTSLYTMTYILTPASALLFRTLSSLHSRLKYAGLRRNFSHRVISKTVVRTWCLERSTNSGDSHQSSM